MMKFSYYPLISLVLSSLCQICNCAGASLDDRQWISPDKALKVNLVGTHVSQRESPTVRLYSEINGQSIPITESPLIRSPFSREFAGITWLEDILPRWVDNQYIVFEDPSRSICVIDAKSGKMLLNTAFESISNGPDVNTWAAIRYRPITRNQEALQGNEKDTIFLIDLQKMISASSSAQNSDQLFSHLQSASLPGIAIARPLWVNNNGSKILKVAIWNWDKNQAEALSFDPQTLALINRVKLDLDVPNKVTHSPWIDREFEPQVIEALTGSSANKKSSDSTLHSSPASDLSIQSPQSRELTSATPKNAQKFSYFSPISVVIGAGIVGVVILLFRYKPQ